jgi:ABC-type polysaccharide/polyol phosphate export permease
VLSTSSEPIRPKPLPDGWVHREAGRMWKEGAERMGATDWLHALWVLTRHEFRVRYRAQALGVIWSLLNPIVMMGILSFIFSNVFPGDSKDYPIYVLIGLVVWQLVSNAANASANGFIGHAELLKRTVVPRVLLPTSVMLSYGINFLIESVVVIIFIPIFPHSFTLSWTLVLIPVVLFFLLLLLVGVALAVASLNVIYRDVQYLVSTGLMILYWLTPLIYFIDKIESQTVRTALKCNPLTGIVNALRGIIMDGHAPSLLMWASVVVPSLVALGIGWLIFRHYEQMVLDNV